MRAPLLLLILAAPTLAQQTIQVPRDQPTIQAGVDAAVSGDTVLVSPGTYVENVVVDGKVIELRAALGPAITVIDGNQTGSCVVLENGADGELEGFTLTNGLAGSGGGLAITHSSPTVHDCVIRNNGAQSDGGGIAISVGAPTITNCVVRQNGTYFWDGGGIHLAWGAGTVITHCTIVDNHVPFDGWGAGIWDATGGVTISNCIVKFNEADWSDWDIGWHTGTRIQHTCFNEAAGTQGNIDKDPRFVDLASGDVHLRENSPCRDQGMPGAPAAPWLDLDGNARGAESDMGADEYGPAAYVLGPVIPGAPVTLRAGGDAPGAGAVLWIDTDLRNLPLVTSGGDWWLKDRCVKVLETTTGPKGWTTATWDVPANAKGVLYMQAWVGATVTPVAVEDVD